MNNVKCLIYAGGVFSKVMVALQNIEKKYGNDLGIIDNIYLKNLDERIDSSINPFDFVFQQIDFDDSKVIDYTTYASYIESIPDNEYNRLKIIISKLKFNEKFEQKFQNVLNSIQFGNKNLGVHIRLTDMNSGHGSEYGNKSFDHYVNIINEYISQNEIDKIFISSDNDESLNKLISLYGDKIIYGKEIFRAEFENGGVDFQLNNFSTEKLWVDSFIDMLLLSKCDTIIHRVSNFANAAKVFSNNLKQSILI